MLTVHTLLFINSFDFICVIYALTMLMLNLYDYPTHSYTVWCSFLWFPPVCAWFAHGLLWLYVFLPTGFNLLPTVFMYSFLSYALFTILWFAPVLSSCLSLLWFAPICFSFSLLCLSSHYWVWFAMTDCWLPVCFYLFVVLSLFV